MLQPKLTRPAKQKPEATSTQRTERERAKTKEKENEASSSTRMMRRADAEGGRLSREEIETAPGQEIMNSKEGKQYLEYTLLTVPRIPYTAGELVSALFQTSMLPGIKAS
jgi:hypothetical protein